MKLSDYGFTQEELDFIRLVCKTFNAQEVKVYERGRSKEGSKEVAGE